MKCDDDIRDVLDFVGRGFGVANRNRKRIWQFAWGGTAEPPLAFLLRSYLPSSDDDEHVTVVLSNE